MQEGGSELNTIQALALLELPPAYCAADAIRKQYRALAKKYHPDNSRTGDEDRFEEVQSAYDFFSAFFEDSSGNQEDTEMEPGQDGWEKSFALEFFRDAESYAPPSKNLSFDVDAVRKALAQKPVDYEGLLLRAEWLEHNLTDGSYDGVLLLGTLGEVQKVRDKVEKAEKSADHISQRLDAVENLIQQGEDLLLERKSVPTIGNIRYKASLTRRFHTAMKRAEDCMSKIPQYRRQLSQLERFCRKVIMSRRLLKKVQVEQDRVDDIQDYYDDIVKKGRILSFPSDRESE